MRALLRKTPPFTSPYHADAFSLTCLIVGRVYETLSFSVAEVQRKVAAPSWWFITRLPEADSITSFTLGGVSTKAQKTQESLGVSPQNQRLSKQKIQVQSLSITSSWKTKSNSETPKMPPKTRSLLSATSARRSLSSLSSSCRRSASSLSSL